MTPAEALARAARCIDLSVADGLIDEHDAARLYSHALIPFVADNFPPACRCGDGDRVSGRHGRACPLYRKPARNV